MKSLLLLPAALALIAGLGCSSQASEPAGTHTAPRRPDVIYLPTPQLVVDAMLTLANVRAGEKVYDLGCGDGRAVITAARDFGARGVGVDIDPKRIAESRANAEAAGVTDRVQFKEQDLFRMSFADADVLFLYLLPELNVRLRPRILDELRPGTRVVSHSFRMGDWEPDEYKLVNTSPIFFWVVPAKIAGTWQLTQPGGDEGTLVLAQEFQKVNGTLTFRDRSFTLADVWLRGRTLKFRFSDGADGGHVTAEIDGKQLTGTIQHGPAQPGPLTGRLAQD